ncbi:MAG: Biopolymer transport protein ExbD/TolR [Gemmataceae bacterium]|nr:Biopolymer transport protein ExbD/TolR [Gemmataceae bacterium]
MSTWQVRAEGSPTAVVVPSATDILSGLRDGIWLPTDEVKGPTDAAWTAIEAHPAFEEAAAELELPPPEPPDETHLDMNPLIDVCLVLLIFFILTITYASLERAIDVPQDTPEEKGSSTTKVEYKDIKDRVFRVTARMDGEQPVIKLEADVVKVEELEDKMKQVIDRTGRSEMLLDIDGNVPWGIQTAIMDAAKGNKVHNILCRPKPRK